MEMPPDKNGLCKKALRLVVAASASLDELGFDEEAIQAIPLDEVFMAAALGDSSLAED